jgi:hypothetical protein
MRALNVSHAYLHGEKLGQRRLSVCVCVQMRAKQAHAMALAEAKVPGNWWRHLKGVNQPSVSICQLVVSIEACTTGYFTSTVLMYRFPIQNIGVKYRA